jgi:hypothetical protein
MANMTRRRWPATRYAGMMPGLENTVVFFQRRRGGLATGLTLGEGDHDISLRAHGNHG